nr:lysophospholipid acyltransferase family protein [Streptomyces sp. NRRL S-920]
MFYLLLKYVILGPLLRLMFRPRIEGLEHVPESGAAIVAGNHLSFSDHFLMPAIIKRRITFLAKAEYFTGPGLKGRLTAAFFHSAGQIPVDRSGKEAGQAAIREGLGVLRKGELLGIYPEGTRSHDGRLYKGKVGVAAMALKAEVPVIPCAMIGTFEAQPPGQKMPNFRRVTIRFGEPLDFSRYVGMDNEKAVLRAVTDEIMYAILGLSGQEYVDKYAAVVKAEEAERQGAAGRSGPWRSRTMIAKSISSTTERKAPERKAPERKAPERKAPERRDGRAK